VLVSEAELAVYQAESSVEESKAQLEAAMGDEHSLGFTLVEESLPVPLEPNVEEFINLALRDRPDLQALQFSGNAAHQYAAAEKKLSYPSVSLLGAAGEIPELPVSISMFRSLTGSFIRHGMEKRSCVRRPLTKT
jgi:outer membrane protein